MNSTQSNAPNMLWSAALGQSPAEPPLVAGDLLLVPTQEPGPSSQYATLHALNLVDGNPRWQRPFEHALVSGLVALQTSEVSATPEVRALVSTTSTDLLHGEGMLVALDAAGEERWRWAPGVQRVSAPAVVRSDDFSRSGKRATKVATMNPDVVCVTADVRTLAVLDLATGEERARIALEASASLSAPALAGDVAVIPCRGPHLLAVGVDGEARWHFVGDEPDAWLDKTPAVAGEHLFAVLSTGAALALRVANGTQAWRVDVGPAGKPLSPPATDGELLFVGARDGLHALDLVAGREVWAFPTPRRITAAPVVAGGMVYAACHDHHLYALDAASGQELWRYELGRRIEVSPALVACGERPAPCVLVADRGGIVTAVARPLSAAEHEAAGHWVEAACAYADLGQLTRAAELLEAHGYPLEAAELWKEAGERERAAVQYEADGAWRQAADLWAALGRPMKQAEALEAHAGSLEGTSCRDEVRAEAWAAAARAFEAEGEVKRTATCQREVARCLRQPVIALDVQLDKGLVLNAWSRLQFVVRNEGYGPARNLVIHATGDEFEGQVTATRQITTLRAGRKRTEWLDVRPLEYGDSVPLRVSVDYENQAKESCICEQTIYIPVAPIEAARGGGGVVSVFPPLGALDTGTRQVEEVSVRRTPERRYLAKLRQMLATYFDEGELRTLCFDLGLDYEDLPGAGKANKARDLVAYLVRRGRISELVRTCEHLRPNVSWGEPPKVTKVPPTPPAPFPARYHLDYEHGLSRLREWLSEHAPALLSEFHTLEARLLDNLRDERLYGGTETVRAERARVLQALNELSGRARVGPSFNDLCRR